MQLKVIRETKKKIVSLTLETSNFTTEEDKMLEELGEPIINFEKAYGETPVSIEGKKIKSLKYKVKFDCNVEGTEKIANYIETFLEDITELLCEEMSKLKEDYNKDLSPTTFYQDIKY